MFGIEKYLTENRLILYVQYRGEKRKLFLSSYNTICMTGKGRKRYGYPFSDWGGITKVYFPDSEIKKNDKSRNLVEKYRREASKATFTNRFIRDCLNADANKDLYENSLTTGNAIDGKIISVASIAKIEPQNVERFRAAMKNRTPYHSHRFPFRGYDGSLEVTVNEQGEPMGSFAMEFKNCGNGYYYLLINDENFIGYDVD